MKSLLQIYISPVVLTTLLQIDEVYFGNAKDVVWDLMSNISLQLDLHNMDTHNLDLASIPPLN